jgi:hypothetical protein
VTFAGPPLVLVLVRGSKHTWLGIQRRKPGTQLSHAATAEAESTPHLDTVADLPDRKHKGQLAREWAMVASME